MFYLVQHLFLFLLIAFTIGLILGWINGAKRNAKQ